MFRSCLLQVPPGSATPLALVQPTASRVALLLDHRLQDAPRVLMHPLTNTVSVMMSGKELDTFLRWAHHLLLYSYA